MALHYPNFNPDILAVGPIHIRWYGLVYVIGLLTARFTLMRNVRNGTLPLKYSKSKDSDEPHPVDTMVIYLALGIMLGGRLGYILFYNLKFYLENPTDVFKIWEGGMAFHGAFAGVAVATYLIGRRFKIPFLQVGDHLALVTPMCLGLGRLANFINGELVGRVTDVSWGMVFPGYGPAPRHPSQVYEFLLEGVLLQSILFFSQKQFKYQGRMAGIFVCGYAICRFVVENFREPDPQLGFVFGPLTMGQLLSAAMLIFGIWLIRRSSQHRSLRA